MKYLILAVGSFAIGVLFSHEWRSIEPADPYSHFVKRVVDETTLEYFKEIDEANLSKLLKSAMSNAKDEPLVLEKPTRQAAMSLFQSQLAKIPDKSDRKSFTLQVAQNFLQFLPPAKRSKIMGHEKMSELNNQVHSNQSVFSSQVSPRVLYLRLASVSTKTKLELEQHLKTHNSEALDTLLIDLRNNIGGAVENLPELLTPFIGTNQYAYELKYQDKTIAEKTAEKTSFDFSRFKKKILLVNRATQSSAELFASVLKKYNFAVIIGEKTAGRGTIDRLKVIDQELDVGERLTLLVVHALMLGEKGEPIEGRGIAPDVLINDPKWPHKTHQYFESVPLIRMIKQVWQKPPA